MPLCKSDLAILVELLLSVSLVMVTFLHRMKWLESHELYSQQSFNVLRFHGSCISHKRNLKLSNIRNSINRTDELVSGAGFSYLLLLHIVHSSVKLFIVVTNEVNPTPKLHIGLVESESYWAS
jgi:hypothetical protein